MSAPREKQPAPITEWSEDRLVDELAELAERVAYPVLPLSSRSYSAELQSVKTEISRRLGSSVGGWHLEMLAMQKGSSFANPFLDGKTHTEKIREEKEKLKSELRQKRKSSENPPIQ